MNFFQLSDPDLIQSPALIVDAGRVERNIAAMVAMVDGSVDRLRPHVKTHKMSDVIKLQLKAGVNKFKTATLLETQMVAEAGGVDVLVAHQMVGPKISRLRELVQRYPQVAFSTIVDNVSVAKQLAAEFASHQLELALYVDIDCGMHRTGVELGASCEELIQAIGPFDGVKFRGLHVYDGHLHEPSITQRHRDAGKIIDATSEFLLRYPDALVVGGGSPTFAVWAEQTDWQCSPGTPVFWDVGYGGAYPDLKFEIAAALLTRVISKPGDDLLCFDIGYKAISSEMPLESRVVFSEIPDATLVSHSEEHLVVRTEKSKNISIGDSFLAFPTHICPTVASHAAAHVVRQGKVTDEIWTVTARDR